MNLINSDRLFLIYTNAPLLKDSPKDLKDIFHNIYELWPHKMPKTLWRIFLTAINTISNFEPSSVEWSNFLKTTSYRNKSFASSWINYEANMYHSYSCDCTKNENCPQGRFRSEVHKYFTSLGQKIIYCYQCDQIAFHLFLNKLIGGEIFNFEEVESSIQMKVNNLSLIQDFQDIFNSNHKFINVHNLECQKEMIGDNILNDNTIRGWENLISLQDIILGLIGDDIIDFINFSDYRLIKKCDYCNKFYIAKKLNPKQHYCPICSPKNKWSTEKRTDYMQTYRKNPVVMKKEANKKREAKIQHLMMNAGKTRKEAEQIIDNDM